MSQKIYQYDVVVAATEELVGEDLGTREAARQFKRDYEEDHGEKARILKRVFELTETSYIR